MKLQYKPIASNYRAAPGVGDYDVEDESCPNCGQYPEDCDCCSECGQQNCVCEDADMDLDGLRGER